MHLGKAGGLNDCVPEHFRYGGFWRIHCCLFRSVIELEYISFNFRVSKDVPVFKGGWKEPTERDSYRKISLVSIMSKIFEMLLAERSREWFVPDNLHYLQGAAQKYCSSMHTSLVVQESIAYMRNRDSEVFMICLDTRKAFDTLWHEGLFHKLYQAGMSEKLWRILWKLYHCSGCCTSLQMLVYTVPCVPRSEATRGVINGTLSGLCC